MQRLCCATVIVVCGEDVSTLTSWAMDPELQPLNDASNLDLAGRPNSGSIRIITV